MYYNLAEIDTAMTNLVSQSQGLVRSIPLPEQTAEGRACRALCVGAPATVPKPAVLVLANVHGNELGSCEITLNLVAALMDAYHNASGLSYPNKNFGAAEIKSLLDRFDLVLFPLVNPDGRHHAQTSVDERGWRKNRRITQRRGENQDEEDDEDAIGVDINRNFDFLFDASKAFDPASAVSSVNDRSAHCYHGPFAFSEAESRNVRWLLDTEFPTTGWLVDLHSPGPAVRYVWGDDEVQGTDRQMSFLASAFDKKRGLPGDAYREYQDPDDLAELKRLAQRLADDMQPVNGTAYDVEPAFTLTPYCGTSHDYAYSRHLASNGAKGKVLGFLVEWGFEYRPPWNEMEDIIREVSAGLIGFCLAAAGIGRNNP